jgi:putative hydrolase of the HAD superfamily
MKKRAVFFDLYGTLIDIQTDEKNPRVFSELSQFLSYYLVKASPEELERAYFGAVKEALTRSGELYPEADVFDIFREIMTKYGKGAYTRQMVIAACSLFRSLSKVRFGAFEGVYDTLRMLSGDYKLALVSDAQWVFSEPELEMLGLRRFFKDRIFSSKVGFRKPDVRIFQMAMKKVGADPEDSIYVGDNPDKDLTGAKRSGMKCVLFRAPEIALDGFRPERRFDKYSQLEEIVKELLPVKVL